jgi:MscS family membrane protein
MAFDRLTIPSAWPLAPASEYGLRWLILKIWQLMFLISIARILLRSIDFFTHVLIYRSESPVTVELANFLKELIKVVMMILCIFAGLRLIFSVDITALVASLGIGGLAVALAAQDTLANLLGSFIIYLDKPFKVGDNIEAGDIKGVVEHVGFRSTKIRTVEKSLLTVPNKKLIDTPLNNITQTEAKRVSLIVGLNYQTTSTQVLAIVADLKETLNNHPDILPDFTVKFTDLNTVSINITVIYFVKGNDSSKMLTVKEQINVDILSIVEKHGAEFAQQNNNR